MRNNLASLRRALAATREPAIPMPIRRSMTRWSWGWGSSWASAWSA